MDTKKLRQKILDLAIRGKLVPQDPNDEPASVLLERIRAEKEHLISEGKIKRPKKSKISSSESHYQQFEPPFAIPNSWEWVTIGELLVNRDAERVPVSSSIRKKQTNKIYDYYGATGVIDKVNDFLFNERLLLVGEDGANLLSRNRDNAFFAEGKYWVNNHAHILDCHIKCMLDYVAIVINSYNLEPYITGSAQPKLSQDNLIKIPIPLPPLAEQHRILKAIEDTTKCVDTIISNKLVLEELISFTKSKILELAMQGKLVPQDPTDEPAADMLRRINPKAKIITDNPHYPKLPDNWVLTTIKDTFKINPKNKVSDETLAAFVPMNAIQDGFSNSFVYEERPWKSIKSGFTHFADGDVAVAKISPCLENRKSIVLRNLPNGIGAGTTELLIFRSEILIPEFSLLYFKSDYFIKNCTETFNGVVGQQRVGKNIVEEVIVPVPPKGAQKKIVECVHKWFSQLDKIKLCLLN